ncbi:hypothetical protein D8B26_000363 [Coccidioides posadasii str. Silveira]|uniref:Uncharacterized protein n=1 Tax=Coccidioides posadasii (strain RMSCC 757 / Silveira) TaxID=443226 RepID=E9D8I5_COCPS|nr:conserved hypothetical protein [Coccidioides posadasii str. Silveira]QVM05656.1 hypothetical protein D8B26_000363 [Coccidioides posadasii str. Silveira]
MDIKAFKVPPISVVQKKPLTCYYWKNSKCKFKDSECRFMHENTGKVASVPKSNSTSAEPKLRDTTASTSENDDLISLFSYNGSPGPKLEEPLKTDISCDTIQNSLLRPRVARISAWLIIRAIRENQDYDSIKSLLTANSFSEVKEVLITNEDAYSTIYAAIYANRPEVVKLLIDYGANPNATDKATSIPLLAYAILNPSITATEIVRVLLCLGANPHAIPSHMWESMHDHHEKPQNGPNSRALWCDEENQSLLKNSLNISMKYYLLQASKNDLSTSFQRKGARHLSPSIVGQNYAIKRTKDCLTAHRIYKGNAPLVMAFVGLPGHGKRTLARTLGNFQEMSPLNTTGQLVPGDNNGPLAPKSNKGGLDVVFIDGDNVDHSWLKMLLNGVISATHRDAETCKTARTKVVYILSLTQSEESASRAYANKLISSGCDQKDARFLYRMENEVESQLRTELIQTYGASIAGRIQHIIPFVPFTPLESSVLAHRFLIEGLHSMFCDYTRRDYPNSRQLHRIELRASDDVYRYLGAPSNGYGARFIEQKVTSKVVLPIVQQYLEKLHRDVNSFKGLITIKTTWKKSESDNLETIVFGGEMKAAIAVDVE